MQVPKEVRMSVIERGTQYKGESHTQGVVMEKVQLRNEVVVGAFEERGEEPRGACLCDWRKRVEKQGVPMYKPR